MRYLLDTHVLLWWYQNSAELPEKYINILSDLENAGEAFALSEISLWEIAKLVELKKIEVKLSLDQWFGELESDPLIAIIPIDSRVCLESTRLGPSFHKDPADQIISASARVHGLRLLTCDRNIISSAIVSTEPY